MIKPILTQKNEFVEILADYKIGSEGVELLRNLHLALLVAPTSVGKNTIIDLLLQTNKYKPIISDTTRPPRVENGQPEANGVRYFFRTEQELLADLRAGKFLEASLIHDQQVSGISLRELKKANDQHLIAINEVEVIGADNIIQAKPDTFVIFILPPSFEEWVRRLHHRGQMAETEVKNRMRSMQFELTFALKKDYYHFVINDDLNEAVQSIRAIIETGSADSVSQQDARILAQSLLDRTHQELG